MGCSLLLLASTVSGLGGLLYGYELAIISGGLLQLKAQFHLTCVQQEVLVSSLLVGALLSSLVGGTLIDRYGRRKSILLSNALMLTGSLIQLISSYPALLCGRFTVGVSICLSSMSCCIFVSEMVTPERRGFLVTLYEAGITVGILAAYTMNYILFDLERGWTWMFGLAVVPTLVQLVAICFLPSNTGRNECDLDLTTNTDTQEECESKEQAQYDIRYLFKRKDNMRSRTVVGLGLVLFQQFTGQPNVLFYASTIFHSAGFQSADSAVLATVGVGLVKVLATFISMVCSDRVGRRPLLISGCCVMALGLITIGLLSGYSVKDTQGPCNIDRVIDNRTGQFQFTDGNHTLLNAPLGETNTVQDAADQETPEPLEFAMESSPSVQEKVFNWIILVCVMAVVAAYSIGFGPMTWLLLSEIFPAAVRGRAFALSSCFNWSAHLLVTFTFLDVFNAVGLGGTFLMYGVISVVAAIFFYFLLPETKGKTLDQINKELRFNRFHRNVKQHVFIRTSSFQHRYQRVHCQAKSP
ncbi:solute carrier family 2, facilitated glucose transporter member 10 isoform X1 [Nerophis lumbriciformis]|uniref:solute carrier family 2, facilitated glucose transporter member 10 isoform X1 n=1 Tax=Nerophis lumbriciformis TaxID=546530 RepID=UPI002ADF7698|nr:solute carrier family 2, facilitated glucose transporter member 10-like isoform X1 [Nerophis lumbriciformis]XP_061793795.1 solute carrier family 2, facilitated glucose transporter member 10-like isoform X1 [Nerophis lumbriciformis]XP_061793803.1 solute carrier family 2, facilitated glucose transporter member 10-like isoform X1 [Nerophis lumbriciformis]XP_061793805.1 solute carrier family 2, facilitated glucose transporter member 10-like isoform X1 [Nerophis lumbriciformis]XP_061793806.1 solu